MYKKTLWWILCFSGFIVFPCDDIYACRYNVRDVGFVNFESTAYKLIGLVDESVNDDIKNTFQQIAFAALLDSNIDFEFIDTKTQSNHPSLTYFTDEAKQNTPSAVLVSPKGKSYPIQMPPSNQEFKEKLWDVMDLIIYSDIREEIVQGAIDSYCVILFMEGDDQPKNEIAIQEIDKTIKQVKENMNNLPKEIDRPPITISIKKEDRKKEQIVLWSLGIQDTSEPHAAIIYGRARKIGDILKGSNITVNTLLSIVSVVGLSCECGLDRSWMMGTMLPVRWTDNYRETITKRLGFDPENPMVKTEISQIMSINNSGQRTSGQTTSTEDLLMGYGEFTLDFESEPLTTTAESNVEQEVSTTVESHVEPQVQESISDRMLANTPASTIPILTILLLAGVVVIGLGGGLYIFWKAQGRMS
jgi:hypothetical protein